MKKTFLFSFLLFFSFNIFAQIQIKGKIIDAETQENMPYVSIYVLHKNIGTITNLDGFYKLNLPSNVSLNDTICFRLIGYTTQYVKVKNIHNPLNIKLSVDLQKLESVNIKARRTKASDIWRKSLKNEYFNKYREPYFSKILSRKYVYKGDNIKLFYRYLVEGVAKRGIFPIKDTIYALKRLLLYDGGLSNLIYSKGFELFLREESTNFMRLVYPYSEYKKFKKYKKEIDTVIITPLNKIYVIDVYNKRMIDADVINIKKIINKISSPKDFIRNTEIKKLKNMIREKRMYYVKYFIDAKNNYNIIKKIVFYKTKAERSKSPILYFYISTFTNDTIGSNFHKSILSYTEKNLKDVLYKSITEAFYFNRDTNIKKLNSPINCDTTYASNSFYFYAYKHGNNKYYLNTWEKDSLSLLLPDSMEQSVIRKLKYKENNIQQQIIRDTLYSNNTKKKATVNLFLTGTIKDSITHKALSFVNIYLKNHGIGTISNNRGEFTLYVKKSYLPDTILFSLMGYQFKQEVVLNQSKTINIQLKKNQQLISEITIKAEKANISKILQQTYSHFIQHSYIKKKLKLTYFYRQFAKYHNHYVGFREGNFEGLLKKGYSVNRKSKLLSGHIWLNDSLLNLLPKSEYFVINDALGDYLQKKDTKDLLLDINYTIDTVIFNHNYKTYVLSNKKNDMKIPEIYNLFSDNSLYKNIKKDYHSNNVKIQLYIECKKNVCFLKKRRYMWLINSFSRQHFIVFDESYRLYHNMLYPYHRKAYRLANVNDTMSYSVFSEMLVTKAALDTISHTKNEYKYLPEIFANFRPIQTLNYAKEIINKINANNHFNTIKEDDFRRKAIRDIQKESKKNAINSTKKETQCFNNAKKKATVKFSLTGTIKDSITHKTLEFCNVVFKNISDTSQKTIGCITNQEGQFKIDIPLGYNYLLQISMLGYKTASDTIEFEVDDEDIDYSAIPTEQLKLDMSTLYLVPNNNLLETVNVKESAKSMDIDKQSIIVTKKMRENTIAAKDVLNKMNGITYNRVTHDIKVDNDKKVKILVDGVEKDRDYILNLNPKRIKKIDILRNITGIYQIDGYTSVINIITFDNYRGYDFVVDDQFLNKFKTSKSPYFLQNSANLNLNITRDKWNYYIKTSGYLNDMNLYNRTVTEFTTNEKIINGSDDNPNMYEKTESYKLRLGADYKFNKKHLLGSEIGVKGFPTKNNSNAISFDTLVVNNINTFVKNVTDNKSDSYEIFGNAYYKYKKDSTSKLISYLYYTNKQTNTYQNINNTKNTNYKKSSDNLNYKIEYQKIFKKKYALTSGGRFLNNTYKSITQDTIQSIFKNDFYKLTVYAYLKIKFNKNTGLLLGSSLENYKSKNDEISTTFNSAQPRINLYKTIKDKHKFILEYKLKTNYPYLSDMNPQLIYQSPFVASMGNPDLKPYLYHNFSFEYRKMSDGIFSYFSVKPYYNYSDNEMGINAITDNNLIIYQNKNFVEHEHYGVETNFSFEIKEKLTLDFDFDIYKDWNKNLNTPNIVDWYGEANLSYVINTKHYLGLIYQKEYAENVSSLGYTKDGTDFIMFYWMTLQFKGRLQFMLGYSIPFLPTQINETYEETPYYRRNTYTDMSIIKNLIMVNLVYRFSKGKVQKNNKNIDYEDYNDNQGSKTKISF